MDPGTPPGTLALRISPATVALVVGESRSLVATVHGGSGTVSWSSSAPDVATVVGASVG
jgi:uncharacterized protein YjdB